MQKKEIEEFIHRLVFNTLIGNSDMHLKTWPLIYKNKFRVLKVSRSKKFSGFTYEELSHLAAKAMRPEN